MYSFVARHPIFNRELEVYAYELLFRTALENVFPRGVDGDQATSNIIMDNFILNNIHSVTNGRRAFINFTEKLLVQDVASYLPPDEVVIEVLENVQVTPELVDSLWRLKDAGYLIALDDFMLDEARLPLVEMADIVKVDFVLANRKQRQEIIDSLHRPDLVFLAEKVETQEDLEVAMAQGFSYFQGYFFCRPQVFQRRRIPESKLSKLQLMRAIHQPDPDFKEITELIKRDVSLTYKLLRYINSAAMGMRHEIESIQQAVVYLGIVPLRKWVSFVALVELSDGKPTELITNALFRARFCEMLGEMAAMGSHTDDLFLVGMFSRVDAMMDRPMGEILDEISLARQIRDTLMGQSGPLRDVFDLVEAYEAADWPRVDKLCIKLKIKRDEVPKVYADAFDWVQQALAVSR
jgi:c-di-GMP-related signal transduction protein